MCWLPVPNELTRTQSRSNGVAALESSERSNLWTVLLLQRCCSRCGIHSPVAAMLRQIWHILIFANILHDSRVHSLSGLRSQTHFSDFQVFFLSSHQSGYFIKSRKTSAVIATDWMVETQLSKLRGTSDTVVGRAYSIFHLINGFVNWT